MAKTETNEQRKAFKDWFDRAAAKSLADQVAAVYEPFDSASFVRSATRGLNTLEFNARVSQFADSLAKHLPDAPEKALKLLTKSLPPPLPDCENVTDGWLQWPIGQFIADYGTQHFEASFEAMTELTKRFSAEYAVRPFVELYPKESFQRLLSLSGDPNPHVRRWSSEAVRPRLPWGRKLHQLVEDPSAIWPILEALKDDPEMYVRRSVANNLNDISKDHPDDVVKRCKRWRRGSNDNRDWVIKHGLRSLIKQGDAGALELMGFGPPENLSAELNVTPRRVTIGQQVTLSLAITNSQDTVTPVLIDYVIHYVRKGGKSNAKVFKWTQQALPAGETTVIEKSHAMKQTTVRALYAGDHTVEVQVNGRRVASATFELTV